MRKNPDKPWDKSGLSRNQSITLYDIDNLILPNATDDWNWWHISQFVDMEDIRQNPTREWAENGLSYNKGLTIDDVDNLVLPNAINDWNWFSLFPNSSIWRILDRILIDYGTKVEYPIIRI